MVIIVISILVFLIFLYFSYIYGSLKRTQKLLKKYSKVKNSIGLTGGEFIRISYQVLGYSDCDVQYSTEKNSDCYIPKLKLIVINKDYCFNSSLSALGVSAHELGHCIQQHTHKPLYVLTNILRWLSKLASFVSLPLFVASVVFLCLTKFNIAGYLFIATFISLILSISFNLFQIPFEKEASKLGIKFLKQNELIKPSEEREIRKILKAASNTYVAEFYRNLGFKQKRK